MKTPPRVLIVDDTPENVLLLSDLLASQGYAVATAASGAETLRQVEAEPVDLILLDVVMPEMSGYEVCRRIRAKPDAGILPIIMVTALDPSQERLKGLEAGADDFLTKPINQAELLARVRSLLRIKDLYDKSKDLYATVEAQAQKLAEWNHTLEQRVADQVGQLERLSRLKRFFAPQIAELIVAGAADDPLKSHRRELTIVFGDLRGFTAFAETADPEEVMGVLSEYHAVMGQLIVAHEGTLERFTGDGVMVFFNDPVPVDNAAERAVRMAVAMRASIGDLREKWLKRGYELDHGVGLAIGYATIGAIGFEGRWDYTPIGTVVNLAARLCAEAQPGQILISKRMLPTVEHLVDVEPVGELTLKGFHRPITAFNILRIKE
jgi:class 3 adenylate cyclase/CheY-like chemotaxis protein